MKTVEATLTVGIKTTWVRAFLFALLVVATGLLFRVARAQAARDDVPLQFAPESEDYKAWKEDVKRGQWKQADELEGNRFGFIPQRDRVKFQEKGKRKKAIPQGLQALPEKYDSRTAAGKIVPVRNQGSCGSCWAFAGWGCLEVNSAPTYWFDLSENHLKNTLGAGCCSGGNYNVFEPYLVSRTGPVWETDDPYSAYWCNLLQLPARLSIRDTLYIPDRDADALKSAIMELGSVYTCVMYSSINMQNPYYYYSGTGYANHAVVLIGWDDTVPVTAFKTTPPGPGAWLVRNSWGPAWGQQGYFWVSYFDGRIGTYNWTAQLAPESPYGNCYTFAPGKIGLHAGIRSETVQLAMRYPLPQDDEILGFGFYAEADGVDYIVWLYRNPPTGTPTSSELLIVQSGTFPIAGFHAREFDMPIALSAGDVLGMVVQIHVPGETFIIPLEFWGTATANPGETFYKLPEATTWRDAYNAASSGTTRPSVAIYAYGKNPLMPTPTAGPTPWPSPTAWPSPTPPPQPTEWPEPTPLPTTTPAPLETIVIEGRDLEVRP